MMCMRNAGERQMVEEENWKSDGLLIKRSGDREILAQ